MLEIIEERIIHVHCDGSSLGNPGPSGVGAQFFENDIAIAELSYFIGNKTNNEAEYMAVLKALQFAAGDLQAVRVVVHSDSMLVINQLYGKFNTNNTRFKRYQGRIQNAALGLKQWSVSYKHWLDTDAPHVLAQRASRSERSYSKVYILGEKE